MGCRIGIITIHNSPNYGACLQSFALYEFLRRKGFDVEIIDLHRPFHSDYIPSRKFEPYTYRFETIFQKIKRKLKAIKHSSKTFLKRDKAATVITYPSVTCKIFNKFNSTIKLSKPFCGIDELYKNPPQYDIYITGSDQVWNPTQSYCIEPYFLTFVNKGRKISFAASIGIRELTTKEKKQFRRWLSTYDAISVREPSAKKLIEQLTGRPVSQVADPTFLLGPSYWKSLSVTPPQKDYILVFTLSFEPDIIEYALKLATESGRLVVSLNLDQPLDNRYTQITDATPEIWLGYIRHANLVITDSFHCTLFSILTGSKNFFTYIGPDNKRGSRIEDLLDRFGLVDHILDHNLKQSYSQLNEKTIDSSKTKAIIELESQRSRHFLLSTIGDGQQ